MEIGEFGVGRPDFGGRRPRGEALGKKKGFGEAAQAKGPPRRSRRVGGRQAEGMTRHFLPEVAA